MSPLAAALLLAGIALVVLAYVVLCDYTDRDPHDGPWSLGAVLLAGLSMAPLSVDAHASIDLAQGGGPCVQAERAAASADSRICSRAGTAVPGPASMPRGGWAVPGLCLSPRAPMRGRGESTAQAAARPNGRPAGVPGGSGSRGAASVVVA